MSIWNEIRCDCCGMRGPGLYGRPRATLLRKYAKRQNWNRISVSGVERDICPHCALIGRDLAGMVEEQRQRRKAEEEIDEDPPCPVCVRRQELATARRDEQNRRAAEREHEVNAWRSAAAFRRQERRQTDLVDGIREALGL